MSLVLGRWDGVLCCGIYGSSSTLIYVRDIDYLCVPLTQYAQHLPQAFLGPLWKCMLQGRNINGGQVCGEGQLCNECVFRLIVHLSGCDPIIEEYLFPIAFLRGSSSVVQPSSRVSPVLGQQLQVVLEQELNLHLICSSCQICLLGEVI